MRRTRLPERKENGWWRCPHPGCPDRRTPGGYVRAKEHAAQTHWICSCGKSFTRQSMSAHRRAIRMYGKGHEPFPSFAHLYEGETRYDYAETMGVV